MAVGTEGTKIKVECSNPKPCTVELGAVPKNCFFLAGSFFLRKGDKIKENGLVQCFDLHGNETCLGQNLQVYIIKEMIIQYTI